MTSKEIEPLRMGKHPRRHSLFDDYRPSTVFVLVDFWCTLSLLPNQCSKDR